MKHLILTVLFIVLCITMNAQTVLKEKVTGNEGVPLQGASVYFPNQKESILCNESGEYMLSLKVPFGIK